MKNILLFYAISDSEDNLLMEVVRKIEDLWNGDNHS